MAPIRVGFLADCPAAQSTYFPFATGEFGRHFQFRLRHAVLCAVFWGCSSALADAFDFCSPPCFCDFHKTTSGGVTVLRQIYCAKVLRAQICTSYLSAEMACRSPCRFCILRTRLTILLSHSGFCFRNVSSWPEFPFFHQTCVCFGRAFCRASRSFAGARRYSQQRSAE